LDEKDGRGCSNASTEVVQRLRAGRAAPVMLLREKSLRQWCRIHETTKLHVWNTERDFWRRHLEL
jgi:hypothetical protein